METSQRDRVRTGDPEAFRELFEDHSRSVYNHAFRLTGTWSAAEDVLSLTYLEAWRLRDRVADGSGSLRPWLLGIATNVARNVRRAARRHDGALARLPRPEPVPDFADEVDGRIVDGDRLARLADAGGLPPAGDFREPGPVTGQDKDGRGSAALFAQEKNR